MRMQSLNRKSLVRRCGGDTVSSPCSVWFPPMWATQRALKFKVLQSGSEWEWETQRRLCVLVIGSARKGFSWKTAREPVGRVKGSWGSFFSMVGEFFFFRWLGRDVYWRLSKENSLFRFAGVSSFVAAAPRARSWLCFAHATKRGFLYLFNFMPHRPWNGPFPPSKTALSPFVAGQSNSPPT